MTFSIILLVIFAAAFLMFGILFIQRVRNLLSTPDEESTAARSDIQQKLREQLDALNQPTEETDNKSHNNFAAK